MKPIRKILVFGSNLLGIHGAGAAYDAMKQYGAVYGQGIGLQGDSYGLPTKQTPAITLPINEIAKHVQEFMQFATKNPEMVFQVTRVGCGLAGYTDTDIAPLFKGAPDNCILPTGWHEMH